MPLADDAFVPADLVCREREELTHHLVHPRRPETLDDGCSVGQAAVEHRRRLALGFQNARGGLCGRRPIGWRRRDVRGSGSAIDLDLTHVRGEAIAPARYQLDVGLAVWLVAEGLSQGVHVLRQVGVIDERLRPERLHQLALAHDTVVVVCEQQQKIEGLRRQGNHTTGALEPAQPDIDPIGPEFVHVLLVQRLLGLERLLIPD